jgi:glycolate oxidase iron-sulfur subunit
VIYHELIEDARPRILRHARSDPDERILRWIFLNVLTHPARLKLAMLPARLLQKLGIFRLLQQVGAFRLLPAKFEKLVQMLPEAGPLWSRSLRGGNLSPRLIERRERSEHPESVAFFEGCIGSVIFEQVNRQSIELLSACGAKVSVPEQQACCGAIHHHNGDHHGALERARRNIDAFADAGLIVTNVAGCGAMLREYDLLLRDDPRYADRARQFASRVRDISEALLELGLPEPRRELKQTATYHDACHLAHAQHVTSAPRELLARIPGLKLVPLPECDMCCGAAGTYNLQHPEMATRLAERKLDNIAITGAEICVTGNVGCAMHLQSQANAREQTLRVVHPVELLHQAVLGERE